MKTTVIIATYNGEKFLLEQLESIRRQTIKPNEVLIYDDGSTDSTINLVEEYIKKYNLQNWIFKKNDINLGYENNFKKLMYDASNDIIFFCDQDDIWNENKIEKVNDFFEKNLNIEVVCTDSEFIDGDGNSISNSGFYRMKHDNSIEMITNSKKNYHRLYSGCSMAVKKSFLIAIEPYWKTKWAQDEAIWRYAFLNETIAILHFDAFKRRFHGNNTSVKDSKNNRTIKQRLTKLNNELNALYEVQKFCIDNNMCNEKKYKLLCKNIKTLLIRIKMIEKRNIFLSFRLLFLLDMYIRKKGFLLDLYLVVRGK